MISESRDEAWPMYHMLPISERFMPQCLSGFVNHDYWSCVIEFSVGSSTGLGCCGQGVKLCESIALGSYGAGLHQAKANDDHTQ